MAIIVQDSFNRANNTTSLGVADTGQTWETSGNWGIESNKAYQNTNANSQYAVIQSNYSDCIVSADITWNNNGGFAARFVDSSNYFLYRITINKLQLYRILGGGTTLLSEYAFASVSGQVYNLKIKFEGSSIIGYLDGIERINVTDTNHQTGTKHGLRQNSITSDRYDNFLVESLGGGETPTEPTVIDAGDIVLSSATNLSSTANKISNSQSTMSVTSLLESQGMRILSGGSVLTVGTNLNITATTIKQGSIDITANTSLQAEGDVISFEISVNLSASTNLSVEGTRIVNGMSSISANGELIATGSAIYDGESLLIATTELTALLGEDTAIIGTVQLEGKRVLHVYLVASRELNIKLVGKRELYVYLKGGVNVTATNQNFTMLQGDTKYIEVSVDSEVDLSGATLTWVLTPRNKNDILLTKTLVDDISILNGNIRVKLNPGDTQLFRGRYDHELEIIDAFDNVSTLLQGVITIDTDKIKTV
jgi:hypothetical protein